MSKASKEMERIIKEAEDEIKSGAKKIRDAVESAIKKDVKQTKKAKDKVKDATKKFKKAVNKVVKPSKTDKLRCIWKMDGGRCKGKVEEVEMFTTTKAPFKCPICEWHLEQHRNLMILYAAGRSMKRLLKKMSPEEIAEKAAKMLIKHPEYADKI